MKKHIKHRNHNFNTRELELGSNDGSTHIGMITEILGDARFCVICKDKSTKQAKARGKIIRGPRKKLIRKNDYVLIEEDTNATNEKYYIVHVYSQEEIKMLCKLDDKFNFNDNEQSTVLFEEETRNIQSSNISFEIDDI